ncbi:hypothetical protein BBUCA8_02082 [Borreliella burgdorferi CA8]|nr:hypothetical protein BBUCA8_02082 [Borreliella burgdorferi CA8]
MEDERREELSKVKSQKNKQNLLIFLNKKIK